MANCLRNVSIKINTLGNLIVSKNHQLLSFNITRNVVGSSLPNRSGHNSDVSI